MIQKGLAVGPFASNCYIVGSEKSREGMIIDPGDEARAILKAVRDLRLKVKLLVVTHGHIDHVGAVKEVKESTGADFAIHADDVGLLGGQGGFLEMMFGVSYDSPPPPDRLLQEGDIIEIGELRFQVLHTPGHSPGGICLAGHGVVFSGDTLFNYGIGRTDFPGSSYEQLMGSIHSKLLALPDQTIVLSGHGPETTIGHERRHNPFLRGEGGFP